MLKSIAWIFMSLVLGLPAEGQTGGISGVVTSMDGMPATGAVLTYSRQVRYLPKTGNGLHLAAGEVGFGGSTATDSKGSYTAQGLPPGSYLICVDAGAAPFLDPCKWGPFVYVQVKSGQTSVGNISLQRGVFLQIRLNDLHRLLPASGTGPLDFPHIVTGVVAGSGGYRMAERLSVDSSGQTYRMPIPAGVPLSLWLFSKHVLLADSQNTPIAATNGARIPFQATTGADQTFTVNVTGAIAQK